VLALNTDKDNKENKKEKQGDAMKHTTKVSA
jgi:hypothetical protein